MRQQFEYPATADVVKWVRVFTGGTQAVGPGDRLVQTAANPPKKPAFPPGMAVATLPPGDLRDKLAFGGNADRHLPLATPVNFFECQLQLATGTPGKYAAFDKDFADGFDAFCCS
jgi:hypothetical protein